MWEALKFLGGLATRGLQARPMPIHVMFLFCDHFEGRDLTLTRSEVQRWVEQYPRVALRHADSGGHPPQHTR